jgi:hypothetical protein
MKRLGIVVLFISLSVVIAGCLSPSFNTADVQPINHDLKIGDTAIIQYNEFTKAVRVNSFCETYGLVYYQTQNIGDKAITIKSRMWVVDWGGVTHHFQDTSLREDAFYPNESRSEIFDINTLPNMEEKAKKGKLTFYMDLGNQNASWIIKE